VKLKKNSAIHALFNKRLFKLIIKQVMFFLKNIFSTINLTQLIISA
jgi:hypothetical protein